MAEANTPLRICSEKVGRNTPANTKAMIAAPTANARSGSRAGNNNMPNSTVTANTRPLSQRSSTVVVSNEPPGGAAGLSVE